MKRIEIEIMRSSDALKAAVDTWHKAETDKKVSPRISFGSIKDLFAAITEKRLELLRYVADQQNALNMRQLAQALGRDYKNVHTDVSQLEELGLIEKDGKGVLSVPYDEIVIHAGLTQAA
jgi:predicted transcriptional regulator